MLFADDIVLVNETKTGINARLELWRETSEIRGFKISWTKTKYVACNFSSNRWTNGDVVKLEGQRYVEIIIFVI